MQVHRKTFALGFAVLLVIALSACSGSSQQGGALPQGTLSVALTDAAAPDFEAVNVTVLKVRVHQSASASENDAGWSDITLQPARKINLLNLTNGVLDTLGQTSLPAGHYTQLRLVLASNSTGTILANSVVVTGPTGTTEVPLDTPSAVQSGIKLINEFDVGPGQRVDLLLDFDALRSVVSRGNGTYGLKPVIRVLPLVLTGIDGFVDPGLLVDNVMVSSQVSGSVVRATIPNPQTGEFFLSNLAAGSYDVVITADGHAAAVIAGVPVTSASSTALVTLVSTSALPITLPTSTMGSISGSLATNPTTSTVSVAYVATKQTFTGGGPTVTVKAQAAELPGIYALSLPVAAPLLGAYGTGALPIAFSPQTDLAGKYAVEASADGYQTKFFDVDISVSDVIQDFTLIPMP